MSISKFVIIFILFTIISSSFAKEPRTCEDRDWKLLYDNDFSYTKIYKKDPCIFLPENRFNSDPRPKYVVNRIIRFANGDYLEIIALSPKGEVLNSKFSKHILYLEHPYISMEEADEIGIKDLNYVGHRFILTGIAEVTEKDKYLYNSIQNKMFVLKDVTDFEIKIKD